MADTTLFELVSPEKLVMSKEVSMVVVPGAEGLFGVLPRHASMLSTLAPGVINVYDGDSVTDSLFVVNGFAEVTEERCTVLAEEVIPVEDIDTEKYEKQIEALKDEASRSTDDSAEKITKNIEEQEKILAAMIKAKTP
ncbi:MAG: ATP synthase F1 subunit epsilon [Rhodospirillaceae bacterium]|jgi:F-type H+-transporting ATPase subunit epsilon|nr:ATP synthase F1 subunit epsilon [Rhodospirillaceae bacterium]|tara:strand:+ start:98 stop:511 length:414 start_codon:yes stop_codon:yes gene_type:complete